MVGLSDKPSLPSRGAARHYRNTEIDRRFTAFLPVHSVEETLALIILRQGFVKHEFRAVMYGCLCQRVRGGLSLLQILSGAEILGPEKFGPVKFRDAEPPAGQP